MARADLIDDSASTHLWARVDKEKGSAFFHNMGDRPIRSRAWKEYVLNGIIHRTAWQLVFSIYCMFNGRFYIDNLTLEIETKKRSGPLFLALILKMGSIH